MFIVEVVVGETFLPWLKMRENLLLTVDDTVSPKLHSCNVIEPAYLWMVGLASFWRHFKHAPMHQLDTSLKDFSQDLTLKIPPKIQEFTKTIIFVLKKNNSWFSFLFELKSSQSNSVIFDSIYAQSSAWVNGFRWGLFSTFDGREQRWILTYNRSEPS